jgi:hypothetical protein
MGESAQFPNNSTQLREAIIGDSQVILPRVAKKEWASGSRATDHISLALE